MKTKIIFRLDTDDLKVVKKFREEMNMETVIIPECVKILIKDKEGYWRDLK